MIVKKVEDVYNYMLRCDAPRVQMKKGKYAYAYKVIECGFDIETTNVITDTYKYAFMYHWQFVLNDMVILGRTWDTFVDLLHRIIQENNLNNRNRLIIWVANLSFEFQFIRKIVGVNRIFAKEQRQPLMGLVFDCIEFRDCLAISGGTLEQLAKDYTTTQKLVGDLDYKKQRNSHTPLTQEEVNYCINDVVILGEWSRYIFDTYIIPHHYIPITKTGILRRKVIDSASLFDIEIIKSAIYNCYPDYKLYQNMMKWLFRGGMVHANVLYVDRVIENVTTVDFTSSYPAVMNQCYFPRSKFTKLDEPMDVFNYLDTRCCIFVATFKNIHTSTTHSIESSNKIINAVNPLYDNGRLVKADSITVFITELDYLNYLDFYTWESVEVSHAWISLRGTLPNYLLRVLNEEYIKKATLKKQGKQGTPEYAIAKSNVNSAYGLTVTRFHEGEVSYINDEWVTDFSTFNFQKEVEKQVLLPQWGIYVSAHARRNLLKVCKQIDAEGNDVVYMDTDSIKMINYEKHKHIIEEYNAYIVRLNKQICETHNLDFEIFNDLGTFNYENCAIRFKTLGSKRYVYELDDGYHVTISGLPKKALPKLVGSKINIFDLFTNHMELAPDDSMKLTTHYNDEPTEAYIDGELMHEESSVALYEIPFTMNMADAYVDFIRFTLHTYERGGLI